MGESMGHFDTLFSSGVIGSLRLRNRIVMAAMGTNFGREDGIVTDRAINYYVERARGGAGLIITESSPINPLGRHRVRCLAAFEDRFIPGLRRLVDAVHENGARIALQLNHAGRITSAEITGKAPQAPSPIPRYPDSPPPHEMTLEEIKQTIIDFGQTALRAREAGFDAVEIHGAHGYLIHQFFSPRTNKRNDVYGGNRENRGRFGAEIVQQVRKAVGDPFPIIFRLGVKEMVEGGYGIREGLFWAKQIEEAGADALNLSGGTGESYHTIVQFISPMSFPEGRFVPLAEAVKKRRHIPVIVANRLHDPFLADEVLREGKADFVAVGRNFLSDPDWPVKAKGGQADRIRSCVACNVCLWSLQKSNGDVSCFQNAALGGEGEWQIQLAEEPKKVLVIGGGPGGMEAARVAGKRGHRVILFERTDKVGGQLLLAAVPPHKKILERTVMWLAGELEHEGVEVRLNQEATAYAIEEEEPDGIIVATGASPLIPGAFQGPNVVTAWDVLRGMQTGKKVLIIGGGLVGAETAEFLGEKGCQVTIVEMLDELAKDMEGTTRLLLLKRLSKAKVSVMLSTKVKEIREGKVFLSHKGEERWLKADTIVLALGAKPDRRISEGIEGKFPEIISIGDCVEARKAKEAIHEGFFAGLRICST
jgi:2,4-dienoyl-CoA reductase-like NADH-dependent reductase (Old Yellow Enzyme family)/NADPH-dependent 2,4-dienoyl-CoA reductase/sulfur reductase-like enzyme